MENAHARTCPLTPLFPVQRHKPSPPPPPTTTLPKGQCISIHYMEQHITMCAFISATEVNALHRGGVKKKAPVDCSTRGPITSGFVSGDPRVTQNHCGANPASRTDAWRRSQLVTCHLLSKSPLFNQQMLIYGWKMIITVFIMIPALHRERERDREREREREREPAVCLSCVLWCTRVMNLCDAQSKARHYATNF